MPSTPVPATGSRGVAARGEAAPGPAIGMGWREDLVTAALAACSASRSWSSLTLLGLTALLLPPAARGSGEARG